MSRHVSGITTVAAPIGHFMDSQPVPPNLSASTVMDDTSISRRWNANSAADCGGIL